MAYRRTSRNRQEKSPTSLTSDKQLGKHLNLIKSGEENTSLELASEGNGARISGDFAATGYTDNIKLREEAIIQSDGNVTLDSDGDINLDADGGEVRLKDDGTHFGRFSTSGSATSLHLFEAAGASTDDFFAITVAAEGSTIIATTDGSGEDANLVIKADGDLTLNSATGVFKAVVGLTEFSVANSAYAGMIVGYRMIGEDGGHASYTLTTSMVVPDSAMTIRFIAPPSGSVEVMVQVLLDSLSGRAVTFGLSDNATYNSLGGSYEQITGTVDETDQYIHQHYWTITGLTAGDTYNYWFGASSNGGSLSWGGTSAGRYPDFIMKVTALPEATSDFAVYG